MSDATQEEHPDPERWWLSSRSIPAGRAWSMQWRSCGGDMSKLWQYLSAAAGVAMALLWGLLKLRTSQRDSARAEARTERNNREVGLAFFSGSSSVGTDGVNKRMLLKHGGELELFGSENGLVLRSPDGTVYKVTVDNAGNLVVT